MKNKFEKFKEEEKANSLKANKPVKVTKTEGEENKEKNNNTQESKPFSSDKNREGLCKMLLKILEDEQKLQPIERDDETLRKLVIEIEEGKFE